MNNSDNSQKNNKNVVIELKMKNSVPTSDNIVKRKLDEINSGKYLNHFTNQPNFYNDDDYDDDFENDLDNDTEDINDDDTNDKKNKEKENENEKNEESENEPEKVEKKSLKEKMSIKLLGEERTNKLKNLKEEYNELKNLDIAKELTDLVKKIIKSVLKSMFMAILPYLLVAVVLIVFSALVSLVWDDIADKIMVGVDVFMNSLTGNGWGTSEQIFFQELSNVEKKYNEFEHIGDFDQEIIVSATHYGKLVTPTDYVSPESSNSDSDKSEINQIGTGLTNRQIASFYYVRKDQLGNFWGLGNGKLVGHLVGVKISSKCIPFIAGGDASDWEQFVAQLKGTGDTIGEGLKAVRDFGNLLFSGALDAVDKGLDDINIIRFFWNIVQYGNINEDYIRNQFREAGYANANDNIVSSVNRIIEASKDGLKACPEGYKAIPRIVRYMDYDNFRNYLVKYYINAIYPDIEFTEEQKEEIADEIFEQKKAYRYLINREEEEEEVLADGLAGGCSKLSVIDGEGNETTMPLEDFVARIVSAEAGKLSLEAQKAQAVAARTYILKTSNVCKNAVGTKSNGYNYTDIVLPLSQQATDETKGEILTVTGEDGKEEIFLSEFSKFPRKDNKVCTVELSRDKQEVFTKIIKQPSNIEKIYNIPVSALFENDLQFDDKKIYGDCHGMSQWIAEYYSSEYKMTYGEILSYFYDAKISKISDVFGGDMSLPLLMPEGRDFYYVSSPYGWRISPTKGTEELHSGIDLPMSTGTPIYAVADGKVIVSYPGTTSWGHYIVICHDATGDGECNYYTLYAHQSKLIAKVGQEVSAGEQIGEVGSTGNSTGPHLHLELCTTSRCSYDTINPDAFLRAIKDGTGAEYIAKQFLSGG